MNTSRFNAKRLDALGFTCTLVAALGASGCATTGDASLGGPNAPVAIPSVTVGSMRVLDRHVNPLVPIQAASESGGFRVTFAHARESRIARLDSQTLDTLSWRATGVAERRGPSSGPDRIQLDDGRILVCWTQGNGEQGRAVIQVFDRGGTPRGAPITISPPDADVIGAPRVALADDGRIVVTFVGTAGEAFELMAVPLQMTVAAAHPVSAEVADRR